MTIVDEMRRRLLSRRNRGSAAGPSGSGADYATAATNLAAADSRLQAQEATRMTEPTTCPSIYDPVMGMDGKQYSSPCHARAAGTQPVTDGPTSAPTPVVEEEFDLRVNMRGRQLTGAKIWDRNNRRWIQLPV